MWSGLEIQPEHCFGTLCDEGTEEAELANLGSRTGRWSGGTGSRFQRAAIKNQLYFAIMANIFYCSKNLTILPSISK